MTALLPQRDCFSLDEDVAYLTCATMTPLLKSTVESGKKVLDERAKPWLLNGIGTESLLDVKEKAAKILNADSEDIAWVTCSSAACSVAAYNFIALGKLRKNSTVVIIEDQFWSNVYPWQQAALKMGAKMVAVKADEEGDFTDAVMQELEMGDNVIVSIPTVLWSNGSILDIARIGKYIKENRLKKDLGFFIDATQTLGAVPFDVKEADPDFLCASAYKWLLGEAPGAIMYVRKDPWHTQGVPLDFHMTNTEKFGGGITDVTQLNIQFKNLGLNQFYPRALMKSAARFNNGGNPDKAKLCLLQDSLKQIIEWKIPNIEATCRNHTNKVEKYFDQLNEKLQSPMFWYPKNHAANIIGVKHVEDDGFPDALAQYLKERNVLVASRFGYLRISPYVHNTSAELQKMFNLIDEFIDARYINGKVRTHKD